MKSKKNIKSIIGMAIILVVSLMFLNMSLAANNAKIAVETANLRETASSESKILAQMSINDEVEIIENSEDWCKVKYKNITGYVKSNLLSTNKTDENTTDNKQTTQNTNENETTNTQTSNNNTNTENEVTNEVTNQEENTKTQEEA